MIKTWIITRKNYGMKIKLIDNKNIKKRRERQRGRRNIGRNTIPHYPKSMMKSTWLDPIIPEKNK